MSRRVLLLGVIVLTAMAIGPVPVRGQGITTAIPLKPAAPPDNPTTPEKVALGRLLFWDPILSGNRDVACATCHHPDTGYSDAVPLSVGVNGVGVGARRTFVAGAPVRFAKRNSQTVLNTGFNGLTAEGVTAPALAPMFWDLRAKSLETQALEPSKSAEEMRGDAYSEERAIDTVVTRLKGIPDYVTRFRAVFPDGVTAANLGRAIAAFERSLVAVNSPYDRYLRGERTAMTPEQIDGMQAFEQVGCARCHSGPMFSDFKAHVLGAPENPALPVRDGGMNGTRAFRTPTLRNLSATGPYMHSGAFASLNQVLRFYNRGGRGGGGGGRDGRRGGGDGQNVARAQLDPLLRQLRGVGRSRDEIVAFLGALNDDSFDRTVPSRVPSGLRPGGRIE